MASRGYSVMGRRSSPPGAWCFTPVRATCASGPTTLPPEPSSPGSTCRPACTRARSPTNCAATASSISSLPRAATSASSRSSATILLRIRSHEVGRARAMLADIDAVVFDLDGTLLDRRRSFEQFVRDQWKRFPSLVRIVEEEKYVQALIELDRNGYAQRRELFAGIAARFDLPVDLAPGLLSDYRAGFPSACQPFPDAVHTLSDRKSTRLNSSHLGISYAVF